MAWWAIFRKEEMRTLNIEPKFRDICRPLTDAEKELLHRDLLGRGMLNPIIVWQGKDIIVDGHNRYAWATQNKQPFEVKEEFFADEDSVLEFIIQNQLGRRNIDSKTRDYLQGELLETRKRMDAKFIKGTSGNPTGKSKDEQEPHCEAPASEGKTAVQIGKELGVSRATIERNAQFARAVDKLGIKEAVMRGEEKRSKKEIVAAAFKEDKRPDAPPAYVAPEGDDNEQEGGFPDLTPSIEDQKKENMAIAKAAVKLIKTIRPHSYGTYEAFQYITSESHKHRTGGEKLTTRRAARDGSIAMWEVFMADVLRGVAKKNQPEAFKNGLKAFARKYAVESGAGWEQMLEVTTEVLREYMDESKAKMEGGAQ